MTGAEFRCLMESLGLTPEWLAKAMGVNPRTVRRWCNGVDVPPNRADELSEIAKDAGEVFEMLTAGLRGCDTVYTYRVDSDVPAYIGYPAAWHRSVCARLARAVPGLRIEYKEHKV